MHKPHWCSRMFLSAYQATVTWKGMPLLYDSRRVSQSTWGRPTLKSLSPALFALLYPLSSQLLPGVPSSLLSCLLWLFPKPSLASTILESSPRWNFYILRPCCLSSPFGMSCSFFTGSRPIIAPFLSFPSLRTACSISSLCPPGPLTSLPSPGPYMAFSLFLPVLRDFIKVSLSYCKWLSLSTAQWPKMKTFGFQILWNP